MTVDGQNEQNETMQESAKRNLFEETGIIDVKVMFGPIIWESSLSDNPG